MKNKGRVGKKKRRREGYTQKRKENNEGLWIWVGG